MTTQPNVDRANPKGGRQTVIANGTGAPLALESWQSSARFLASATGDSFLLPDVFADADDVWSLFHLSVSEAATGVTVDVLDVGVGGTKIYYNGDEKGTSVAIPPGASLSIVAVSQLRWEIVGQVGVYAEPGTVVEAAIGEIWVDAFNGDDVGDGSPSNPYRTFAFAYGIAKALNPDGQVKSATNRVVIRFRKGTYPIYDDPFDIDTDFIDCVGEGNCFRNQYTMTATGLSYPDVVIHANNETLSLSCNDAIFRSITFEQHAALGEEKACLELAEQVMANIYFKDVGFRSSALSEGTVRAVVQDRTAGNVYNYAKFEDCHTLLSGFLFNGKWSGNAIRCSAESFSFCGFDTTSSYSDPTGGEIVCGGYMEDCLAYEYSFGSISGSISGGYAESSGTKIRCFGSSYCFGAAHYTGMNGISMTAKCSGTCVESQAGAYSFGYSDTGAAECAAAIVECSSLGYSFGCAVNASTGTFSGSAYRTIAAGNYCFGSNAMGGTPCDVDADSVLEDCQAGTYSFGAIGTSVNGTFRRCRSGSASFGQATAAQTAMLMDGCEIVDIEAGEEPIFDGVATIIRCKFKVKAAVDEASVGINDDGPRLYACDFYGSAATVNVKYTGGGVSASVKVAHCRMNVGLEAVTLTNEIGTGYNVVDSDYVC